MSDQTDGYYTRLADSLEQELFLDSLRSREQAAMQKHGNCTCAAAPMCPMFRHPDELFEEGLPDDIDLHQKRR